MYTGMWTGIKNFSKNYDCKFFSKLPRVFGYIIPWNAGTKGVVLVH